MQMFKSSRSRAEAEDCRRHSFHISNNPTQVSVTKSKSVCLHLILLLSLLFTLGAHVDLYSTALLSYSASVSTRPCVCCCYLSDLYAISITTCSPSHIMLYVTNHLSALDNVITQLQDVCEASLSRLGAFGVSRCVLYM
jgi:Na+/serine symporter